MNWMLKSLVVLAALLVVWFAKDPLVQAFQPTPSSISGMLTQRAVNLPQLLKQSWQGYRSQFVQGDGRVIDHKARAITTSEGQSYALLRAAWMDDRGTFDSVLNWTNNNLRVRGDQLFAWKWGKKILSPVKPEGPKANDPHPKGGEQWTVLDATAASDADQDIALALFMAYRRWGSEHYRQQAMGILRDLWDKETTDSALGRILLPGDWHKDGTPPQTVQLNPSYYAPYAYRVFASVDKAHDWNAIIKSSYAIWAQSIQANPTRLTPDWIAFDRTAGQVSLYGQGDPLDARSDYGYEAFRGPWRQMTDLVLFGDQAPRSASRLLKEETDYLKRFWEVKKKLPGPLTAAGIERYMLDSNAQYGGLLPVLAAYQPKMAYSILQEWVVAKRNQQAIWVPTNDYYAQNWYWFGLALLNEMHQQEQGTGYRYLGNLRKGQNALVNKRQSPLDTITFLLN